MLRAKHLEWIYGFIGTVAALALFFLLKDGGRIVDVGEVGKKVESSEVLIKINAEKIDDLDKRLLMINDLHREVHKAHLAENECKAALAECRKKSE